MAASLVDSWRKQLAEHEASLQAGDALFAWHHALYARIYRFLLSFYPELDPPRIEVAPLGPQGDQAATRDWEGRPARTTAEIAESVRRIQRGRESDHPAGPLVGVAADSHVARLREAEAEAEAEAARSLFASRARERRTRSTNDPDPATEWVAITQHASVGYAASVREMLAAASIRHRSELENEQW